MYTDAKPHHIHVAIDFDHIVPRWALLFEVVGVHDKHKNS